MRFPGVDSWTDVWCRVWRIETEGTVPPWLLARSLEPFRTTQVCVTLPFSLHPVIRLFITHHWSVRNTKEHGVRGWRANMPVKPSRLSSGSAVSPGCVVSKMNATGLTRSRTRRSRPDRPSESPSEQRDEHDCRLYNTCFLSPKDYVSGDVTISPWWLRCELANHRFFNPLKVKS